MKRKRSTNVALGIRIWFFIPPSSNSCTGSRDSGVLDHVLVFTYDTLIPEIKGALGSTKQEVWQCHQFGMTGSHCMERLLVPHDLSLRIPFTSHPCSSNDGVPFGIMG